MSDVLKDGRSSSSAPKKHDSENIFLHINNNYFFSVIQYRHKSYSTSSIACLSLGVATAAANKSY